MSRNVKPLHYAIIEHFVDGRSDCAADVIEALQSVYGDCKMLAPKDVEEALATAKENGILEEASYELDAQGMLVVRYRMTDFGHDMVRRYLR